MITLFEKYKNYDDIIEELSQIKEPYISGSAIHSTLTKIIEHEEMDGYYISNDDNYEKNIYYHVNTNNDEEFKYSGVGHGFYLGKDPVALKRFYDLESILTLSKYNGDLKWFNLMRQSNFDKFKNIFKQHDIDIINSYEVSIVITNMGYDGIRYYDVYASGEEFVLFNESKLKKIS